METKRYLTHVNALRGLAILLVVLYHLRETWCPQGFLGVDAFFVISGFFLIPSMLSSKDRGESFSWWKYYRGKLTRILPPLLVMVLAVLVIAVPLLTSYDLMTLAKTARKVIVGDSNTYFGTRAIDYFSPDVKENPFLHTWYISVLLQVFLIAPLLCIPLSRLKNTWRALILALLGACSFVIFFQHWLPQEWQEALPAQIRDGGKLGSLYYMTLGRLWEILAGALILLLPACSKRLLRSILLGLGLALLLIPCFWRENASVFPLLAVIGTMLIIRYGEDSPLKPLVENKGLMWLGSVSFSLYLVHWPVMAISRYALVRDFTTAECAGVILLSLALTWLMYRYVEKRRPAILSLVGLWASAMLLIVAVRHSDELKVWLGLDIEQAAYYSSTEYQSWELAAPGSWVKPFPSILNPTVSHYGDDVLKIESPIYGREAIIQIGDATKKPSFVLLGDSYANALMPGLDIVGKQTHWSGLWVNVYMTPIWGRINKENLDPASQFTREKAEALKEWLSRNPHIRHILIGMRWSIRFEPATTWDGERIEGDAVWERGESGLREFCHQMQSIGKEVILVMPTPEVSEGKMAPITKLINRSKLWYRPEYHNDGSLDLEGCSKQEYDQEYERIRTIMNKLETEGCCKLLDPYPILFKGDAFYPLEGNDIIVWDHGHLTVYGSTKLIQGLKGQLQAILDGSEAQNDVAAPQPLTGEESRTDTGAYLPTDN